MPELSYDEIRKKLSDLFESGDYEHCKTLATESSTKYPEHIAYLNYLRMCSAARLQENELSLSILSEMLDNGIWYSEELLRNSPSLTHLQNEPLFQKLLLRSISIKEGSFGADQRLIVLHDSGKCVFSDTEENIPCPILVALHSNGELPQTTISGWKSAAQLGMLVAIPKSSKTLWAGGGHYWINHHEASSEIYNQLSTLPGNYYVDEDRLLFGGFSMGGEIALWMTLQGMLNARGFILLAPSGQYFKDPVRWKPLIEDAQGAKLRGVIITNENEDDNAHQEGLRRTVALLNEYRIETKFKIVKESLIQYPANFAEYLREAIEFIFT